MIFQPPKSLHPITPEVLMRPRLALLLCPVLLATLVAAPEGVARQQRPSDRITLDLYLEWQEVSDPQLSPDGRQIVYSRRYVDKVNDRWDSALWIMNADGSKNRFLLKGSSPQWSPDGTRIAFLAPGEPRGTQVFVRWMDDEGAVTQVTRLEKAPASIAWSPDGKSIAFQMLVPHKESWPIQLPARPEGAKWVETPRIVTALNYRRDRAGFIEEGSRHLFVVSADGGMPRQLTEGDYDHGAPRWTPDGREILFSGLRVPEAEYEWRESEIYALDVASRQIRQLTSRRGPDNNPVASPDGKLVAYTGYDHTTDTWRDSRLYVMNRDGSSPRVLTESLDRSPSALTWAADGSGIYFNVDNEGSRNLYFASLKGEVRAITQGQQMLTVSAISKAGIAVGVRSSTQEPNDVVTFPLRAPQQLRRLTGVNDDLLAGRKLGTVEEIWYRSVDDFRIQGWIVKPPDFDPRKKYPLMLEIHGGPHSMYNVGFSFARQEHVANGYVILYTNPRGSTGYGSAFGNAIKNAYPGKDYDDLMAGVDSLLQRGYIDEKNLFVFGCSGGGVLTSWIVGHTDRFAAASANCPVTNWLSFVGTTDGSSWYRNFEKLPWEDPSEHLRRSPLMYVGNVKTPTMLMTGINDLRTPMSQTEEYYEALKVLKVPTAMVRFNEEWHGTSSRPSNFMRTQLYLRSWFERHARRPGAVSAAILEN
jgi:dipeptidyl aminopeptidase/acylaminoacyl peptidase